MISRESFARSEAAYDTETYCRKISSYALSHHQEAMEKCLAEEESAREELDTMFPDTDVLRFCLEMMDDLKLPNTNGSYTMLKTCLDHEIEAKKRYQ